MELFRGQLVLVREQYRNYWNAKPELLENIESAQAGAKILANVVNKDLASSAAIRYS